MEGGGLVRDHNVEHGLNHGAVVIAPVGDSRARIDPENSLRLVTDISELRSVRAAVRHLVRDDPVVLGIDRDLHIVADDTGAAPARGHRATVGIGQGYLAIG